MRNRHSGARDDQELSCAAVREALSARLDGESESSSAMALAGHLAWCAECRAWQEAAHQLTRRVRLTPAPAIPDLTAPVVEAVLADRAARRGQVNQPARLARIGLAAAAACQLVVIIPALVFGQAGIGVPPHAARELGAFNLALAIGFVAAALRPALARGTLPLVGAATAALVLLSVVDTAAGQTTLATESPHLIAVAGWLLLRLLVWATDRESGGPDVTGRGSTRGRRTGGFWWRLLAGGRPMSVAPRSGVASVAVDSADPDLDRKRAA